MRQVIAIHGGDSFATYPEFLTALMQYEIHFERLFTKSWRSNLPETLSEGHEVILPRMPNAQNAKYQEWKIWFEKHVPYLTNGVALVGHSLGGSFLAKYLSEEKPLPISVGGVFLVASPFDRDEGRTLVEFNITNDLAALRGQADRIFLYHSSDDSVVAFEELAKFRACMPDAVVRTFADRGHFNQPDFPELIEDIRSLV